MNLHGTDTYYLMLNEYFVQIYMYELHDEVKIQMKRNDGFLVEPT